VDTLSGDAAERSLPSDWGTTFGDYQAAWASATTVTLPGDWQDGFREAEAAHDDLIRAGRWQSGPRSLLGVLGLRSSEVDHSKVLAWLLDPTARHGLGSALLERLLVRLGMPATHARHRIRVAVEEECQPGDRPDVGYVDIVVRGDGWTVVIENKVWSGQHGRQLDTYHASYTDGATTFAFLTPDGIPARSADPQVAAAYIPLSWRRHVIPDLQSALDGCAADSTFPAAALDYLTALTEEFR
jgi:hypothetical protein